MKNMIKTVLLAVVFVCVFVCVPVNSGAQTFEKQGTTFISKSATRVKVEPTKTKFTWKDSKGTEYPIYISKTGSCFVMKLSSKTNKEYKYYLGPEISEVVCKELGIEYKSKKKS